MINKLDLYKDIIVYFLLSIIIWLILGSFDAFELIIEYLETHEEYELDELLLLFIILGILSIFYALRKVHEARKINAYLEELNKQLEEKVTLELSKQKKQELLLLEQSKLASMGEMIGNIAHQWRQPLNSLSLIIQNIKFSYDCDELDEEFMNSSINKANRITKNMSSTIDDFRSFYSPNKEKCSFNLVNNINKSISLVESTFIHHNIEIKFDDLAEIKVFGFENEFSQTILNILNNAKDALVENKVLNGCVKIRVEKDEQYGNVIIEDNAGGIPSDIMNKIFEPYFTTKEEGKGTGIGLYMSKTIIEKNMSGKLFVENLEKGAMFIIKVPLEKLEK